ncbi:MAG: ATP-binding protein [Verrucomicrobia bacterium]|nr:ATP-binding protein [Verrucomicrobiota bacterium]
MKSNRFNLTIALPAVMYLALTAAAETPLNEQPLRHLEERIEEIDSELEELATFSMRSGLGALGYRSDAHPSSNQTEWIQIELGKETPVDQIVIVPSILRGPKARFNTDGFPVNFQITAGSDQNPGGTVIAAFDQDDQLLPRTAPLVIPCATTASWVRVEASILSPRNFDGQYNLELAEIMVFNGQENVALKKPVSISSHRNPEGGARKREFLVDGFVPYLMDAAQGRQSLAFTCTYPQQDQPVIAIDLGAVCPVDLIHLHSVDLSDTIPQSTPSDFGIPRRFLIEGATQPDFSDARPLIEHRIHSFFDAGPILMLPVQKTACRYIRLTALEPYIYILESPAKPRIGFAEIEVFSNGRNVALNKKIYSELKSETSVRSITSLTDGHNLYGHILSIRGWLNQLARRHDLETERPLVVTELRLRYARQKTNLRLMIWLATLLAAGIGFTILIDRMLRMRQITKIRDRFAADLHDELGANLHTIGLLSDLAEESKDSPDELSMFHQRIRTLTERTGTAMRHCADLLEADGLYTSLSDDMQRAAGRILATFDHDIAIEGKEYLAHLKPQTRTDLFLFYKECLINISRHSGATQFSSFVTATPTEIHLAVRDNGSGLHGNIPSSLKRRARLLGAKMKLESPAEGGTVIHLTLRVRWNQRSHL